MSLTFERLAEIMRELEELKVMYYTSSDYLPASDEDGNPVFYCIEESDLFPACVTCHSSHESWVIEQIRAQGMTPRHMREHIPRVKIPMLMEPSTIDRQRQFEGSAWRFDMRAFLRVF